MCSSPPLPPVCGPFQAASCWNSPEGAKCFPPADTSHVIEAYCTITIGYNSYMHCTHWSLTPHNNPMRVGVISDSLITAVHPHLSPLPLKTPSEGLLSASLPQHPFSLSEHHQLFAAWTIHPSIPPPIPLTCPKYPLGLY